MFSRNTRRALALMNNGLRCSADNGSGDGGSGGSGDGDKGSAEDAAKLKQHIETLQSDLAKVKDHNKTLFEERKRDQEKARQAAEEAARKGGDVEALEKSWQEKLAKAQESAKERIGQLEGTVSKLTRGQTATTIANELAVKGSAKALLPHIEARLVTEHTEDGAIVRVLDQNGKPSAMSLDELKEEFRKDAAFAPLLAGSKASGSGGSAQSAAGGGVTIKRADLEAKTPKERARFFKQNPEAQVVD
jgi:DNA repair exonuclease SbcCD ATPase subunit